MKSAALESPASCFAYLRSLPKDQVIDILDGNHELTNPETDAACKIVGGSATNWAYRYRRWSWTADELVAALERDFPTRN